MSVSGDVRSTVCPVDVLYINWQAEALSTGPEWAVIDLLAFPKFHIELIVQAPKPNIMS